jgi:hypothetical protein
MLLIPDQTLKDLFQNMADLSKKQCEIDCFKIRGTIGGCCSDMYCDLAIEYAKEIGVSLTPTGNKKLPLMGEEGCTAPPWLRPMCTLHICDKSLLKEDFNKAYFSLREKIDLQEEKLFMEQSKKETIQ